VKQTARRVGDILPLACNIARVILTLSVLASGAQSLLSGRVVDSGNQGIPGVEVHLVNKDLTATTGADGSFELYDDATVREATIASTMPAQVKLAGGRAEISTGSAAARVSIGLYELRGRLVAAVFDDAVGPMQHRSIPLVPGRPGNEFASGVYVARVTVNGQPFAVRSFSPGGAATAATLWTGQANGGLQRAAVVVDSAWFSKDGCTAKKLVVEQYNADLGDVTVECHGVTILPPEPPCECKVPAGAQLVSNTQELKTALASGEAKDIVLADGTYDNTGNFTAAAPHRLWGQSLGGAVIKAGFDWGSNYGGPGGEFHCLRFDVEDPSKVFQNAIVRVWGTRSNVKVRDCFFEGHGVIGWSVFASQISGVELKRLVIHGFVKDGIRVDGNSGSQVANPPVVISDIDVSAVSANPPLSSNGTSEAGIWLGCNGSIERVKARAVSWSGIETVTNCNDPVLRDLDIEDAMVGIYLEHYTRRGLFEHFWIGNAKTGMVCEWADPGWGGKPGAVQDTIQDGVIESSRMGIWADLGTDHVTFRRMTFRNQCYAGIVDLGIGTTIQDNDYSGIDAGASEVSTVHPNNAANGNCQ